MNKKKPSLLEVAKEANVSPATVSRVFNNNPKVNREMKERVLDTAKRMGYKTNIYAKALIEGKTNFISLILTRFEIRHYSSIIFGIETTVNKAGYRFFVTSSRYSKEKEIEKICLLNDMNFAGIIIISVGLSDDEILELTKKSVPILVFDRKIEKYEKNCVYFNYYEYQKKITNLLINNGHRKIAHISGPTNLQVYKEKLHGYIDALKENGLEKYENVFISEGATNEDGYNAAKELLKGERFTAIDCQNDQMAFGAMCALKEKGFKIPDDVSITGFGNVPEAQFTTPSLTTINFDHYTIGKYVGRKMISIIKKEEFEEDVPPFKIIERKSIKKINEGAYEKEI